MENEEDEIVNLKSDIFQTSFKNQDVTKLPAFKKWKKEKEKEGKNVVRCPICFSYEIFVSPTNHECNICGKEYCQQCFKICVSGEVNHDHKNNYCEKICSLINALFESICEDFVKNYGYAVKQIFILLYYFYFVILQCLQ